MLAISSPQLCTVRRRARGDQAICHLDRMTPPILVKVDPA